MCSGQSNMGFTLSGDWNGDIDAAASKFPNLRLIKVPQVGTQELQNDFKGQWRAPSTKTSPKLRCVVVFFIGYPEPVRSMSGGLRYPRCLVSAPPRDVRQ